MTAIVTKRKQIRHRDWSESIQDTDYAYEEYTMKSLTRRINLKSQGDTIIGNENAISLEDNLINILVYPKLTGKLAFKWPKIHII